VAFALRGQIIFEMPPCLACAREILTALRVVEALAQALPAAPRAPAQKAARNHDPKARIRRNLPIKNVRSTGLEAEGEGVSPQEVAEGNGNDGAPEARKEEGAIEAEADVATVEAPDGVGVTAPDRDIESRREGSGLIKLVQFSELQNPPLNFQASEIRRLDCPRRISNVKMIFLKYYFKTFFIFVSKFKVSCSLRRIRHVFCEKFYWIVSFMSVKFVQ